MSVSTSDIGRKLNTYHSICKANAPGDFLDPIFSFYKEIHKLSKISRNVWFVPG